ncbi:hypothetical protein [Tahibacter caeni]|uniref:hypothetical protein n=1 Tax=Tahibacter caeni TaxID=1453545 RepID=UPI0021485F86|nr:hypothetical protein [Tahibacter caeni]
MIATSFPARLHVLLARDVPFGVVIRRGPSKVTALVGWNRRGNTFTLGQWLRGRIYERRSDLSPDGQHLIYFAMNGRWSSATRGSWTAISRAPYLKALTLYAKGDGWNGGGLFRDARRYWLNDGIYAHALQRDAAPLRRVDDTHRPHGECPTVYYERLARDGWTPAEQRRDGHGGYVLPLDKPLSARWILRKYTHATVHAGPGRGCYFDTHELVDRRSGAVLARDDWEWADVVDGRLVWACGGRLLAAAIARDGDPGAERLLHDFNPMRFEAVRAPY